MGFVLVGYSISLLSTIIVFIQMREKPLAKPEMSRWPSVTLALPFYNEKFVVDRILDAVINLDYPPEKLQVIILDDSTDETSQKIDDFLSSYVRGRLDILVLRRRERKNYKTGALRTSMDQVKGEFIGVFDADFIPPSDFLKEVIPHFSLDTKIGFIQTRWGYVNSMESIFTLAQSISLDIHFVIEKAVEQKLGLFINYNGSAGVWRKNTIIDCGGWPYTALSEDLELSYRAQTRGWKALYLPHVIVPSELISSAYLLGVQQERWAFGGLEVFRSLWQDIIKSRISPLHKFHALSVLLGYCIFIVLILQPVLFLFFRHYSFSVPEWSLVVPVILMIFVNIIAVLALLRRTHADWLYRAICIPIYVMLIFGFSVRIGWGAVKGLLGMKHEFVRTPKGVHHQSSSVKSTYSSLYTRVDGLTWRRWLGYVLIEATLSIFMLYGGLRLLDDNALLSSLVLFFYGISYLLVAIATATDTTARIGMIKCPKNQK